MLPTWRIQLHISFIFGSIYILLDLMCIRWKHTTAETFAAAVLTVVCSTKSTVIRLGLTSWTPRLIFPARSHVEVNISLSTAKPWKNQHSRRRPSHCSTWNVDCAQVKTFLAGLTGIFLLLVSIHNFYSYGLHDSLCGWPKKTKLLRGWSRSKFWFLWATGQ